MCVELRVLFPSGLPLFDSTCPSANAPVVRPVVWSACLDRMPFVEPLDMRSAELV
jgi:hypothetical protein